MPVQELDKEASAVYLDAQTENGHQAMRYEEVLLDEILGDPKVVIKSAKAHLKMSPNREVYKFIHKFVLFSALEYGNFNFICLLLYI